MQPHEKLGDLDNKSPKLTGNAAYWAKRMPRTFARNAEAFKFDQAQAIKKAQENLVKLTASKPKPPVKIEFPKVEIEKENLRQQRQKLEAEVFGIIGSNHRKSVSDVILVTAYVFDLVPIQIVSKHRRHWIVLAKMVVANICNLLGYTASHIGREMGYSDHTTVLHQLKRGIKNEEVAFYIRKVARMIRLEMEGKL